MIQTRKVAGKAPDLIYTVHAERLADGQIRTVSIEGPIRLVPGRLPHSGDNRSAFDHHGHLIADEFGGPGTAESGNFVPMHGHANNGAGRRSGSASAVSHHVARRRLAARASSRDRPGRAVHAEEVKKN